MTTKMPGEKDLQTVKQLLDAAESSILQAKNLLFSLELSKKTKDLSVVEDGKIIEGVFDGERMIGPDKKTYHVPVNYASKSKLVPGDVLKLTILDDGSFLYKQIGPVKRKKMIGILEELQDKFMVVCGDTQYRVLPASITYFKAKAGDRISIMIPEDSTSEWAAVDNIIESL